MSYIDVTPLSWKFIDGAAQVFFLNKSGQFDESP